MHKGLPHNTILNYTSGAISSTTQSALGTINLPRDLSAVNRQHWEHTTPKGVPLVYRVAITISPTLADGSDANSYLELFTGDTNLLQKVRVQTCHNNWVMRNAAVKTHFAREAMFRKNGVKKGDRGAYDKTIHYTWDGTPGSFLTPFDGDGNDFTGGDSGASGNFQDDWEYSKLIYTNDASGAYINLIDAHTTEETQETFSALCLPQLYLASRQEVEQDSNTTTDQPASFSILRKLFTPSQQGITDEIVDLGRDNQDEAPYDLAVNGDWTEPVLAASAFIGMTTTLQATMVVDVPFGLFSMLGNNLYIDAGQNLTNAVEVRCEVMDIFPMGEF